MLHTYTVNNTFLLNAQLLPFNKQIGAIWCNLISKLVQFGAHIYRLSDFTLSLELSFLVPFIVIL